MSPMPAGPSTTARSNPAMRSTATPIEFRVGTDALAVVVSQANEFLTDASLEELARSSARP